MSSCNPRTALGSGRGQRRCTAGPGRDAAGWAAVTGSVTASVPLTASNAAGGTAGPAARSAAHTTTAAAPERGTDGEDESNR